MDPAVSFFLSLSVIVLLVLVLGFRRVPPEKKATIVTFGKPGRNIGPGPTVIIPWIQEIRAIDARMARLNPPIEGIPAKDGVPVNVDLVYTRRVINPRKAQFDVENPDGAILSIVTSYLVKAIGKVTSTQLIERSEIKDALTDGLESVVANIEEPFGVDIQHMGIQAFRLPGDLEAARTDVQTATQQRKAAITRARAEAAATSIERAAEDPYWIPKTQWDALQSMARGPRPPLIVVSPQTGFPALPGVSDDVQRGLLGTISESLERIEKLLGGGEES